jgi:hypothetical protein
MGIILNMDLKEMEYNGVSCIHLGQLRPDSSGSGQGPLMSSLRMVMNSSIKHLEFLECQSN